MFEWLKDLIEDIFGTSDDDDDTPIGSWGDW